MMQFQFLPAKFLRAEVEKARKGLLPAKFLRAEMKRLEKASCPNEL